MHSLSHTQFFSLSLSLFVDGCVVYILLSHPEVGVTTACCEASRTGLLVGALAGSTGCGLVQRYAAGMLVCVPATENTA